MKHIPMEMKLTSRKFLIFLVLFGFSSVALFTSFATFEDWSEFVKWLFGIYAASNVASKYTGAKEHEAELKYELQKMGVCKDDK